MVMPNKIIWLDYDATLVDFGTAWIDWINETLELHQPITIKDSHTWTTLEERFGRIVRRFWQTPGVYLKSVKPFQCAKEFVHTLQMTYGIENVWIITSSNEDMYTEKDYHIHANFGIPLNQIKHHWEKWRFTNGGILMDDYHKNVHDHVDKIGSSAIAFNLHNMHPWAERHMFRFDSQVAYCTTYDEAYNAIKKFKNM